MRHAARLIALLLLVLCAEAAPALAQQSAAPRPLPPSSSAAAAGAKRWQARYPPAPRARVRPDGRRDHNPGRGSAASATPLRNRRVVAFYGSPAMPSTIVGRLGPGEVTKRLRRQSARYRSRRGPRVVQAFDLVATLATADPGRSGLYRARLKSRLIDRYLSLVRKKLGKQARLVLDIQPGRARLIDEIKNLKPFLNKTRVDIAIDPEWNVGPHGTPGQDQGSIKAAEVNRLSGWLDQFIAERKLRPRMLVIHQFREASVGDGRILNRDNVEIAFSNDGIGTRAAKFSGYVALAYRHFVNGFTIFYRLDERPLATPDRVSRLKPHPGFVLYQ